MEAETRLLHLAGELAALPPAEAVPAALRALAAAYAPGGPLPRSMAQASLQSHRDKTAVLALAWARERVRLTLEEVLARTLARGALPGSAETRSWLILAACEAMALEPPSAVADRLRALLELTGYAADLA
ncbi:MAG TPA: hypothetical protein VN646_10705 [Candidatus Acidoferrum sp.]|jgi:hypothetical protein|nr:hypothetical protein [Candidatus Acidoferrum sp.]